MKSTLKFLEELMREASALARAHLPNPEIVGLKEYGDVVTRGDLEIEEFLVTALSNEYPEYGFNAEERGVVNPDAKRVWIIDPIDGSKYFARNIPLYATSIALQESGRTVLGAVCFIETGRLFSAISGGGALENGVALACSREQNLSNATLAVEIPSRFFPQSQRLWAIERLSRLVDASFRIRLLGVGSLSLCFCASGGFDGYVNLGKVGKLCDTAAGALIAKESGADVYEDQQCILAAPSALLAPLQEIVLGRH